jgi:hypothetical protein
MLGMRAHVACLLFALSGCSALAQIEIPPREGICEHPKVVVEEGIPKHDVEVSESTYEKRCILRTKSLALRRGGELRLTFRNGLIRGYKDNAKACDQGLESCKRYILYDFFPEHELLLINIGYWESQEWRLVRQLNGKEETIVAPPRYSPSKKWLASVNWDEFDDRNNGIDLVSATFSAAGSSFHYRPKEYELWHFVRWDGDDRLVLKVDWRVGNDPQVVTWLAEVVRISGEWQLNRSMPASPEPR